jgi:hypothetical protein
MYMLRLALPAGDMQRSSSQQSFTSTLSHTSSVEHERKHFDMAIKFSLSAYAKCNVTPPSINRQHSYYTRQDTARDDATATLARVALRTASPRRSDSPLPSPTESVSSERRTSWEDCRSQRDGYISFPDFDLIRAQHETKASG